MVEGAYGTDITQKGLSITLGRIQPLPEVKGGKKAWKKIAPILFLILPSDFLLVLPIGLIQTEGSKTKQVIEVSLLGQKQQKEGQKMDVEGQIGKRHYRRRGNKQATS